MPLVKDENSYVDVAEGDLYFADRLYADAWTSATADIKALALMSAMLVLEPLCLWHNDKNDSLQPLMFPRGGDSEVPNNIKIAQMEIAFEILSQGIITIVEESDELRQIKAGSASISFFEKLTNPLSIINSITKSMLSPLGRCAYGGGSITAVKLVR